MSGSDPDRKPPPVDHSRLPGADPALTGGAFGRLHRDVKTEGKSDAGKRKRSRSRRDRTVQSDGQPPDGPPLGSAP